jgi:hypothetical protein
MGTPRRRIASAFLFEGRPTPNFRLGKTTECLRRRRIVSDAAAADARSQRFAEAVRSFAGVPPKRFATLLPLREGIAELRLKGASFGMIRELLAIAGIEVATDTVRRFYREVIEEPRTATKPSRKLQRQAAAQPASFSGSAALQPPESEAPVPPTSAEPPRTRGPRVADPRNL